MKLKLLVIFEYNNNNNAMKIKQSMLVNASQLINNSEYIFFLLCTK